MDIPIWRMLVAISLFHPETRMTPLPRLISIPILLFSPEMLVNLILRTILKLIPLVNPAREMPTRTLRVSDHRAIPDLMASRPQRHIPTLLHLISMDQSLH